MRKRDSIVSKLTKIVGILCFVQFYVLFQVGYSPLSENTEIRDSGIGSANRGPSITAFREETRTRQEELFSLRKIYDYGMSVSIAWKELHDGQANIFPRACPRRSKTYPEQVTMAVHASAAKLPRLLFSIRRWSGPVSASIYISSIDDIDSFLTWCSIYSDDLRLTDVHIYMEKVAPNESSALEYPHNILRQASLSWTTTDYFLTLDVDFVTPPQASHHIETMMRMDPELIKYLRSRYLMVFPAFEGHIPIEDSDLLTSKSKVDETLPRTKLETRSYVASKKISPFHVDVFAVGHGATNFSKWFEERAQDNSTFYLIDYVLKFEPYVLGYKQHESLPRYWQDFRGFGFNKWTWLADAYFSGFNFGVMTCSSCFVTHVHHLRRTNLSPNYEEFRRWTKQFRKRYSWTKEEALLLLSDRHEFEDIDVPGPVGLPCLVGWINRGGRILGRVFKASLYPDRELVGTAPIIHGAIEAQSTVTSASGQQYYLSERHLGWYDDQEG